MTRGHLIFGSDTTAELQRTLWEAHLSFSHRQFFNLRGTLFNVKYILLIYIDGASYAFDTDVMTSPLPAMPLEVLRRIVLCATDNNPGPPKEFYSLLLTCKSMLKLNVGEVHYEIFAAKFEVQTPLRRLGKSILQREAGGELRRRFSMLKRIRSCTINEDSINEDLWVAFIMLEDVCLGARSLGQLKWAKLPEFLDGYLRNRLYETSNKNDGWPIINERNSLVIALSWLCLNEGQKPVDQVLLTYSMVAVVSGEEEAFRTETMHLLEPFVFAAFRVSSLCIRRISG